MSARSNVILKTLSAPPLATPMIWAASSANWSDSPDTEHTFSYVSKSLRSVACRRSYRSTDDLLLVDSKNDSADSHLRRSQRFESSVLHSANPLLESGRSVTLDLPQTISCTLLRCGLSLRKYSRVKFVFHLASIQCRRMPCTEPSVRSLAKTHSLSHCGGAHERPMWIDQGSQFHGPIEQ